MTTKPIISSAPPAAWRYGVAVLAVAAATGVRLALDPVLKGQGYLLLFTLAIMVGARFGGLAPGLLATALALISSWFLFEPVYSFAGLDMAGGVNLGLLGGVGCGISLLSSRLHRELVLSAQSREYFRLLSEAVPQLIWTARPDGQWDHVNARWVEYTGLDSSQPTSLNWLRHVHPEDRAEVESKWAASVASGSDFRAEFRIRRRDGTYRWFNARAVAARSPAGSIEKWFGAITNVQEEHEIREALREQNRLMTAIAATAPGVICSFQLRPDGSMCMPYASLRFEEISGLRPEDVKADATPLFARGHPNDVERVRSSIFESARTMTPWHHEFRFNHPDKGEIWVEGHSVPVREPDGSILWHGFIHDVTERKRLEQVAEKREAEIRALAAGLMTAQEDERRRISRELHDDLCQQLAALAIDVGSVVADLPVASVHRDRLGALQAHLMMASEEARYMSHRLHPSMLEDLGLVPSLRALCDEFSQRGGLHVQFLDSEPPVAPDVETAACLYRITQQALQNIVKHAHASHVWVSLDAHDGDVVLSVEDDGAGFDPAAVRGRGGLGLISMEERARLAGGTLSIESEPGKGTRISVSVPGSSVVAPSAG